MHDVNAAPRSICLVVFVVLMMGCGSGPLPGLDDAFRDYSTALPVFPGAEGFGTDTRAGREGTVLIVDTLADDGEGSLRWALAQTQPRTIVFAVGGVITTTRNLEIHDPFVTVAGQTAPDPGITISGAGLSVQTHDVLVQHLAIRPGGAENGPDPEDRDALQMIGNEDGTLEVFNVVIDHVSLSWAIDENISTWYGGVHDITVSNSLIAEALDDSLHPKGLHSKGFLIGDHTRRLMMARNLFAHNNDRNPIFKGDTSAVVVNNFVYNPGRWPVTFFDEEDSGPALASLLGNDFVYGPSSPKDHHTMFVSDSTTLGTKIHLVDNRGWDLGSDQNSLVDWEAGHEAVFVAEAPVGVVPLSIEPVDQVESARLASAGSRPWARNAEDARVIETIVARSGKIIDRMEQVHVAWPASSSLMLQLPDDPNGDVDGDGYTNLEEWLQMLSAKMP